ncbi:hypothetical protein [Undibacterium sp. Tian12W]|uniref:hypothetical protein n=1 Tax=Undibacterium sp. Tian12W TaxID=3413054 RepID=UPI003BF0D91A
MINSNEISPGKLKTLRIINALIIAGKYTAIFLPLFFFYLFASILMVDGDGHGNALVSLTGEIIEITEKLLNLSGKGAAFPACFFWSLVLYAVLFFMNLCFTSLASMSEEDAATKFNQMKFPALLSLLFVFISLTILVRWK